MAAEVVSMAYREQYGRPWHLLGNAVTEPVNAYELMRRADALYNVAKVSLKATLPDGTEVTSPSEEIYSNHSGAWTYLNTIKRPKNYELVQNEDIAKVLDATRDGLPALSDIFEMDTAGVLSDGKRSFICFRMGRDSVKIGKDGSDDYETCGFIVNSYATGEEKVSWGLALTRIVCNNTLMAALGESEENGTLWTFSHRNDPLMWLKFRAELERQLQSQRKAFYAELERMVTVNWEVDQRDMFIDNLYPLPAVPKDSKRAAMAKDLEMDASILDPVLAVGLAADKVYTSRVGLAETNRQGVKGLLPQYEEQFGQSLYATYQASTDWISWSNLRGTMKDTAESMMFNNRFRDAQRLIKLSRGVLYNN